MHCHYFDRSQIRGDCTDVSVLSLTPTCSTRLRIANIPSPSVDSSVPRARVLSFVAQQHARVSLPRNAQDIANMRKPQSVIHSPLGCLGTLFLLKWNFVSRQPPTIPDRPDPEDCWTSLPHGCMTTPRRIGHRMRGLVQLNVYMPDGSIWGRVRSLFHPFVHPLTAALQWSRH